MSVLDRESTWHRTTRHKKDGIKFEDAYYFRPTLENLEAYIRQEQMFMRMWISDRMYELQQQ